MRRFIAKIATIAAGLMIPLALPLSALAATTVTVTPDNQDDWATTSDTANGGTVNYSSMFGAPADMGIGSLVFSTPQSNSKVQYFHPANNISLNNLAVSYYTYRSSLSQATAGQVAALNLVIDYNGSDPGGFDTLVFEPIYQSGGAAGVQEDQWQKWDASGTGVWWSTRAIPNTNICASSCYMSMNDIATALPNAVVQAFGINQGSGNAGLLSGVDGVMFNGWQYDFEPYLVVNNTNQCKNNGYKDVRDQQGNSFKNQGQCVSWVQHNVNGNGNGNQNNQGQTQGASTTNNQSNTQTGTF